MNVGGHGERVDLGAVSAGAITAGEVRAPEVRAASAVAAPGMPHVVACLLVALACSGPTDVVGVVDSAGNGTVDPIAAALPTTDGASSAAEPGASSDDASDAGEVALLLAGRRVEEWPGETLVWPLSMPLGELFAGSSDDAARAQFAPGPSRRLARASSQGGSRRSDNDVAGSAGMGARLLILDEDDARELLSLLSPAAGSDAERAAVFRDERGDIYQVSLEGDQRSLDDLGCFDRMHRDPFGCGGRGSFD